MNDVAGKNCVLRREMCGGKMGMAVQNVKVAVSRIGVSEGITPIPSVLEMMSLAPRSPREVPMLFLGNPMLFPKTKSFNSVFRMACVQNGNIFGLGICERKHIIHSQIVTDRK